MLTVLYMVAGAVDVCHIEMGTNRYGLSICDRRFHLTEYIEDTDRMCCVHMLDRRIEQILGVLDIESIVFRFRML